MSREIVTTVDIAAAPERVWRVLTDFAAYPEWNPFFPRMAGTLAPGAKLDAFMKPAGSRGMGFKPTVVAVEPNRELRWLGHLFVPGIFDGEHVFRLEETGPGRTRLHHSESFRGVLATLVLRLVESGTRQGFEAMNQALKARAEEV